MNRKPIHIDPLRLIRSERGSSVVIFLIIMTLLATLAMGAILSVSQDLSISTAHKTAKKAFYSAEVGLDVGINDIMEEFEDLSVYPESLLMPGADANGYITVSNYRGYDVKYKITNPVDKYLYQTVLGNTIIFHYAYTYQIQSNSISLVDNSRETLNETVRILETPLVQYYIFYGGSGNAADLEILPGPTMNSWGRIHSNGDIYIGAGNTFNLRNYDASNNQSPHSIVAAGNIYLRRKNNGSTYSSNKVWIKVDNTGTTFSPKETITGDITSSNEIAEESRFNNYLLVNEQPFQAPNKTMFVRNGFYEQRAGDPQRPGVDGIQIIGQGGLGSGIQVFVSRPTYTDVTALVAASTDSNGNPTPAPVGSIIRESTSAFCEDREDDRMVDLTDIDLYNLGRWYQAYLADLGLTLAGDGFLIYASRSPNAAFTNQTGNFQAIRVLGWDGTSIPQLSDETTLATDNPIYIHGDFNTINTKGVALVADAINILSNAFPGKSCNSGLTGASTTTINAAFFGGNVPTPAGGGTYSGGLENYPRFHESWSGISCNILGSFINLWTSTQADGTWVYGGNRYRAPGRNWGWDVRFQDPDFWPPFIPSVYSVERVGFLE